MQLVDLAALISTAGQCRISQCCSGKKLMICMSANEWLTASEKTIGRWGKMYAGSKWMVALVLVGVNGAAMAQTVYRVDFKAESERITGFIDLAAHSLGPLTPSEITGWSFSSVAGDPVAFSFSSSDAGAAVFCSGAPGCGLTASATSLTFIPGVQADIFFRDSQDSLAISTPTAVASGNFPAVLINTPNSGLVGFSPITGTKIARVSAPEIDPGSAAGGLTLLLGGLLVFRGRRVLPAGTAA
jgi:hypothetical protein